MSKHEAVFTSEKTVPIAEAVPGLEMLPEAHVPVPLPKGPAVAPKTVAKRWLRRLLFTSVALAALAGTAYYANDYWTNGRFLVSTDDAYVKADSTTIAPKISGYIAAVLVNDNQPVKAGETLARIDDRDFQVALEQAQAQVASAQANIANKQAAIVAKQAEIDSAQATVTVDQANETFAGQEDTRYAELAKKGFGTVQNAQQASSRLAAAHAATARDTALLANVTKQLDVSKAELAQAQAALASAKAAEDQAKLNLSYTNLVAPIDGLIGNRTLRVGQYVQAGTQLMAVVPTHDAYVIANYKETQLTDVHAGQSVDVEIDTFPGQVFKGHVDSLSPASGQEFALLPPDNATGNFTKVVQRIPVKIVLDQASPLSVVLRTGMSVYPTIDTRSETARFAAASKAIN